MTASTKGGRGNPRVRRAQRQMDCPIPRCLPEKRHKLMTRCTVLTGIAETTKHPIRGGAGLKPTLYAESPSHVDDEAFQRNC